MLRSGKSSTSSAVTPGCRSSEFGVLTAKPSIVVLWAHIGMALTVPAVLSGWPLHSAISTASIIFLALTLSYARYRKDCRWFLVWGRDSSFKAVTPSNKEFNVVGWQADLPYIITLSMDRKLLGLYTRRLCLFADSASPESMWRLRLWLRSHR